MSEWTATRGAPWTISGTSVAADSGLGIPFPEWPYCNAGNLYWDSAFTNLVYAYDRSPYISVRTDVFHDQADRGRQFGVRK